MEKTHPDTVLSLPWRPLTSHLHPKNTTQPLPDAPQTPSHILEKHQTIFTHYWHDLTTPDNSLTTLWHSQCSKPPLLSPDITWHFKKASKGCWGSQGCVGRKSERHLQSFRWVKQRVVVLSGILKCFSPIPINICLPMMRSSTFFVVAGCSKSFTNQNVRM